MACNTLQVRTDSCHPSRPCAWGMTLLLLLAALLSDCQNAAAARAAPHVREERETVFRRTLRDLRIIKPSRTPTAFAALRTASTCTNSCFYTIGNLQISGIHLALTHLKTVIVIDRSDSNNTYLKLPGTTQNAYAEEVVATNLGAGLTAAMQRPLNVHSNVFCSTGQFLPDGTLLSIGGSSANSPEADPVLNGSFSIRAFKPCTDKTCDFALIGTMSTKRWYPTAQIMPDGRVLIVGGANVYGNIAINTAAADNPTVEYWPKKAGEPAYFNLQFLKDQEPYNLYPFVHLLPSGKVFILAGQGYTLFDSSTNKEIPGTYPPLAVKDDISTNTVHYPMYRNYPASGTSVMFPLSSANGYTAEIMICGGSNAQAVLGTDSGSKGSTVAADEYCWRIQPEAATPTWTPEWMCNYPTCTTALRRVMGDAVLLVDGSVLILNGAGKGFQGLKQNYASSPVLTPLIYYPTTHSWFQQPLAASGIARMYHSSALLLHDASVLVTGSNPNAYITTSGSFPTEFRAEVFAPPYLWTGLSRPTLSTVPGSVSVGSTFSFNFVATQSSSVAALQRFSAVLINPGFSTHCNRHGMRSVNLDFTSITATGTTFTASVKAPPSLSHAPPGMYWFHVLDNGVPNVSGMAVNVTAAGI